MDSLALKYRPKNFESITGQRSVSAVLRQMVINKTVPNVILFEGVRGSGKTSTARVLASALNCEDTTPEPCGVCESCAAIFEERSLSVREIDASSHGLVDDIRQLQENLLYGVLGKKSIIILDEVQGLSRAAANALLRTLENPPDHVIFILITTDAPKVLTTIRSRCMSFLFRRLSTDVILDRLEYVVQSENINLDKDILAVLATNSDGSMRDALISLDQVYGAGILRFDEYMSLLGEPDFGITFINSMLSKRHSRVFSILEDAISKTDKPSNLVDDLISVLRDILVLQSEGSLTVRDQGLVDRMSLATKLAKSRVINCMKSLWDLKIKMRNFDDSQHGVLYLMATILMEELVPFGD